MTKRRIAVVDYGMGNLRSVEKALERSGARVSVTDSPKAIREADAVVLPGVGAFGEAVRRLRKGKLWSPIEQTLASGKPFLGVCLGLQLLFERSEEDSKEKGFGFFKGDNVRFQVRKRRPIKVPHIGWNQLALNAGNRSPWKSAFRKTDYFYFVHSYFPEPSDKTLILATSDYAGTFCAAVASDHIMASQFHPEKSGDAGLRVLNYFVSHVETV